MRRPEAKRPNASEFLWGLLRRIARESPALLVLGTVTAILQAAMLIPIAVLVRHMFDTQLRHGHAGSIALTGAEILALYAAAASFGYVARAAALRTAARVVTTLRLDVLGKLLELPQRWHDRQRMAAVLSIAAQDTERVETMLATVAGNLMPAVVIGCALLVAALVISPILFLTGLAIIPPLMFAGRLMARRVQSIAQEWSESARRFSSFSQLLLRTIVTTRIVGGERSVLGRGAEQAAEVSERHRQVGNAGAKFAAIESAIAAVAGTAVLVVGGIEVIHDAMTIGDLLAFYAVLGLLLRQVYSVGWQTNSVVIGRQSLSDVEGLLRIDEAEPYALGRRELAFRGAIAFEGVSFSYDGTPVLVEVTLTVAPGEHLAVIGPNGAGKSTLVSLLLALYEPDRGLLRADGVPYEQLDIRSLRRQIGVVLQDPVLLPGTIRENIAYARPEVTDAEICAAAQASTAAEFIEDLAEGYAATIGDEGTGLSGGQRQRIALARALLGRPTLVVLDEPSTYLDDAAVATLMAGLMSLPQAPTVIIVTHDAHVSKYVERVIELRSGRLVSDYRAAAPVGAARV